jgi:hypothetical protein
MLVNAGGSVSSSAAAQFDLSFLEVLVKLAYVGFSRFEVVI